MNFKDEKGFTLVLSFIFITVLVILAGASASVVINESRISQKQYRQKQAYYFARAGAEYAISNTDIYQNLSSGESTAFKIEDLAVENLEHIDLSGVVSRENLDVENDSIQVYIERQEDRIEIFSLGGFEKAESELSLILKVISDAGGSADLPPLDYALFAVENMERAIRLTGSSTITGKPGEVKVGTNAKSFDSLEFIGTAGINGDLWIHTAPPPEPPEEYIEEPRHPDWVSGNVYRKKDKVYYDGLHYEAKWWTTSTAGTNDSWEVIIPDDEIWKWFDNHQYDTGDQVWYDGQIYTAKEGSKNAPPPGWAWKAPVENLSGDIAYLEEEIVYPEAKMPDFPSPRARENITIKGNETREITEDGSYDKISITANNDLIIDRSGRDRIIRVKNLDIKQGHIKFKNPDDDDGILKIYVEDEFSLNGSSSINRADNWWEDSNTPENVEIYYKGNRELKLDGNISLNANLFIEEADLKLRGSSSTSGYIFSGGDKIELSGDVNTSLIYAPKSDLRMDGSSSLNGAAVVRTLTGNGNIKIDYQEVKLDDIPQDFLAAVSDSADGSQIESDEFVVEPIKWSRD